MGLFSRKDKTAAAPSDADASSTAEAAAATAPGKRPGTSGTENLLVNNRRKASQSFKEAARAEKVYKAKKRSAAARANFKEAKAHFRDSAAHLRSGLGLMLGVAKAGRYVVADRNNNRAARAEEKKRARNLEKRKKLEEKLAKEKTGEGEDAEGAEGGVTAAEEEGA